MGRPAQLIKHLPAYELGEHKIHLKRPGTLARLALEEETENITPILRMILSGDPESEVRVSVADMQAIQGYLLSLVTRIDDANGHPAEWAVGWLDDAGPAVALGMLHHVAVFAAMADQGMDPVEVLKQIEAQLAADEEE